MFKVLMFIQCVSVVILLIESVYIFYHSKNRVHEYLFLNCLATLVNNIGYLLEMRSRTGREFYFAVVFSYIGRIFIPLTLLFFILEICRMKLRIEAKCILFGFHSLIYIIILTNEYHNEFYKSAKFVKEGLFPHVNFGHAWLHYVYTFVLLAYIFIGMFILIRTERRSTDDIVKKRLRIIVFAIAVECFSYIMEILNVTEEYDVTMLGYTTCSIIMLIAIFKYDLLDTKLLAIEYIQDELADATIATNIDGKIVYFNKPAERLFPDITDKDNNIVETVREKIEDNGYFECDKRLYSPSEKPMIYNGVNRGAVFVFVDDTLDIQNAKVLRAAKDQAEAARKQADSANSAKSDFLSTMSHEIRTPMNAIVGMTDILLRTEKNEETRKYLANIQRSGDALLTIINDILDFSKIESGRFDLVEEPYDPHVMLEDLRMIFLSRIGDKSLSLHYDIDENLPKVLRGDGLRVRQIIINLVNNAIKFTENGIVILHLDVEHLDNDKLRLKFEVKDTGQGIREEDIDKLFRSFSQVDSIRNHSKEGSGLGLAICKRLIEMMGGEIGVESVYGEGSNFHFDIIQTIVSEEEAERLLQEKNDERMFTAPDAKILLVDDNEVNLTVAEGLMEPLQMKITTAANGLEALDIIEKTKFDLVFMDHMMPVMDGLEATERIRKMEGDYYKNLPIIALSANVMKPAKDSFAKAGMNDSLDKPIKMQQMCKVLRKWLPAGLIHEIEGDIPQKESSTKCSIEIEGLDMQSALENCGSEELLLRLLKDYCKAIDKTHKKLDDMLSDNCIRDYTIEVHALKNTSRMIGALNLSDMFLKLEKFGNNEDMDSINRLHPLAMDEFDSLKPLLLPYAQRDNDAGEEVELSVIKDMLRDMAEAAGGFDYDTAMLGMKALDGYKLPKEILEDFDKLDGLMANVSLDEVAALCSEMVKRLER